MCSKAENIWMKFVTADEFVDYCDVVLRAYCHLTNSHYYLQYGFMTDSKNKIMITIGQRVHIPVYILDMIREICRPMYTSMELDVVCYFKLTSKKGGGLVPGLGWTNLHNSISGLLFTHFNKHVMLTELVEERLGKSPLFVSTDKSFAYSNGSTCPDFRLESVNMLRSYRPRMTEHYLGCSSIVRAAAVQTAFKLTTCKNIDCIGPAYPAAENYDVHDYSDCVIFDAADEKFDFTRFLQSNEITSGIVPDTLNKDGVIYNRVSTQLDKPFHYGCFEKEVVHKYFLCVCVLEAEIADRQQIRSRMCLGNAFRFDTYQIFSSESVRFPSDLNPSKGSLDLHSQTTSTGKKKRKPRKKKKTDENENNRDEAETNLRDDNSLE